MTRLRRRDYRRRDGWLVCGDPLLLGVIDLTDGSARPLRDSLAPIDALLAALLDPDAPSRAAS
jgi:hypothetical protein